MRGMSVVTETLTVRDIGDYEIVVTEVAGHWLSFVVYVVIGTDMQSGKRLYNRDGYESSPDPVDDRDKAQKFIDGSIKWDGCVNLTVEDEPLHFCSREDVEEFGKILPAIYELATELIPNFEG